MIPDSFINFFLASAGAGGALVGLLFVAISIAPEQILASNAPVERQSVAVNAFTSLLNAFIISLMALIPKNNLGTVTLVMGLVSIYTSMSIGWYFIRQQATLLQHLQRLVLVLVSLIVYGLEIYFALTLLARPDTTDAVYNITYILVVAYILGLNRAWQLLGGQRYGFLKWLNPLHPNSTPPAPSDPKSTL